MNMIEELGGKGCRMADVQTSRAAPTKPKESITLRVEAGLPLLADGLLAVTYTEPAPRTRTLSQPDKRVFGKRAEPEDVWGVCSGGLGRNRWKTKAVCEVTERCPCHQEGRRWRPRTPTGWPSGSDHSLRSVPCEWGLSWQPAR